MKRDSNHYNVFDSETYISDNSTNLTELVSLRIYGFKQHLVRARQKRSELHSSVYNNYHHVLSNTLSREHNTSGIRTLRIVR